MFCYECELHEQQYLHGLSEFALFQVTVPSM
jgi:hypothetical protein